MSNPICDPPHPEIAVVGERVLNLYRAQRSYLKSKPDDYVADLLSDAERLLNHEQFSLRVGAEVNRAAALMELQERGKR